MLKGCKDTLEIREYFYKRDSDSEGRSSSPSSVEQERVLSASEMRSVRSVSATRVPSVTSEASSVTVDMVESGSGERGIEDIASWGERARMSNCCLEALGGGLGPGEAAPLALTTGEWDWRFSGLSHSNSDSWELYGKCVSCNEQ